MVGLTLRGGRVLDPVDGSWAFNDVVVSDGLIAGPDAEPDLGDQVIDVTGLLVTPGLVDLHCHVFDGQDLGLPPDAIAAAGGVTTLIDAGSAGGHLFGAFRRCAIERSATRVRAFVNVASIGTTSIRLSGELQNSAYIDEEVAVACIEQNRDVVVGVKVRASADVGGPNSEAALATARRVADRVGLPLMVHLGPAPAAVDRIADTLRAGDILTHAYTGWSGNQIVEGGQLRESVQRARARGVVLDVGHGISGFSADVARRAIDLGAGPDTISTDLHVYSRPSVTDLPSVLGKLLALGMSLEDVICAATASPASAIGLSDDGVGSLRPGSPADVAVWRVIDGDVEFTDAFGASFRGTATIEPMLTLTGGLVSLDHLTTRATP